MPQNPNSQQNIRKDLNDIDNTPEPKKPAEKGGPGTETKPENKNPRRDKFAQLHGDK
jgi:hypothetical protein